MSNLAKIKLYLIKSGFDKDVVLTLPKIFVQEYLEKDYDKLSELLDVFIDYVYKSPKYLNQQAKFGNISCVHNKDAELNHESVYNSFKNKIIESFHTFITRQPLNSILSIGGNPKNANDNNLFFNECIVVDPNQYGDLVCLQPYFNVLDKKGNEIYFIRINDLSNLLLSKGINLEDVSIIMTTNNNGLYINPLAIKSLGSVEVEHTNLKK